MTDAASLIPELERVIQQGSPERCAELLSGITGLFLSGASRFGEDHVAVFDDVFSRLIEDIETRARAELSRRLAPIANAPPRAVRRLADDDDVAVAAPVLKQSPRLGDDDLRDIASTKGQQHLLAISGRAGIGEAVTDVLVQRGDRDVVRAVADNRAAKLSERGFSALVERATDDSVLAEKVGLRADIPPPLFRTLLMQATEVVQQRLLAQTRPETATEIRHVLVKVSQEIKAKLPAPRNYDKAKTTIQTLKEQGRLDETALHDFAKDKKFEETVVALAELSAIPIETVERLMVSERPDPVLILSKAAGFGWPTVRTVILVRPDSKRMSNQSLDAAHNNFQRLSASTAQRVTRFWQLRQGDAA